MHVGARDGRRRWPPGRFLELGRRLVAGLGAHVVLVGGPADEDASTWVARGLGDDCTCLPGRLSLRGTLGALSRCVAFVGNDSGLRHLAMSVGVPTVGLFWYPHVATFGPLAGPHRIVVSYERSCPECGRADDEEPCAHDRSRLTSLSVDRVEREVADVLSTSTARHVELSTAAP
jgi:ADP-heptose:LPS heptosyltransferase